MRALVRSTEAMRRFSFEPAPDVVSSPFAEIRSALESVERAKTALRAMVKYVPVDLVRRLYESGRDPVLGAELMEVSLMFTDIADFTTHAESLAPDQLAQALGRYLEVATNAVEQAGGTVDKYIGDALMVLWNAPEPARRSPGGRLPRGAGVRGGHPRPRRLRLVARRPASRPGARDSAFTPIASWSATSARPIASATPRWATA